MKTTTKKSRKKLQPNKIKPSMKGFGFWFVKKITQAGIRMFRISRVDNPKDEIEIVGRLDFARKFTKLHNNEILKFFETLSSEIERQATEREVRIRPLMALLKSVPELVLDKRKR